MTDAYNFTIFAPVAIPPINRGDCLGNDVIYCSGVNVRLSRRALQLLPTFLMWASAVLAADGRNVVTNFQELAVLSREANVRPAEFDVEATVVSAMPPGARSIVLTDGTIGAYVAPGRNVEDVPSVKRGDRVRVRGRLMDAAPNLPSARYSHLSVIGEGATPDARDVRIGEIRAGRYDDRREADPGQQHFPFPSCG